MSTHHQLISAGCKVVSAVRGVRVRISRESPCGGMVALVRFGGKAIGGKHGAPRSYTTTQTENIKQLREACSEYTLLSTVGVVIMFHIESH
jgi:hypothetical protein